MKRFDSLVLNFILCLSFLLGGCAAALVGAGVAGAIIISKDEVSSFIDNDFGSVWLRTSQVLKEMGEIIESNEKAGVLKARIGDAKVICLLEQITDKTVKLRIKARKNLLPYTELAHSLAEKILRGKPR